jgi:hypothetical protein
LLRQKESWLQELSVLVEKEGREVEEKEWCPWQMGEERSCCCCCFGRAETTGKRGRDLGNREEVWLASSFFSCELMERKCRGLKRGITLGLKGERMSCDFCFACEERVQPWGAARENEWLCATGSEENK